MLVETETFTSLLRDRAHWEFELFLMLLFDGLIFGLLFPFVRVHWRHHLARDRQDKDAAALDAQVNKHICDFYNQPHAKHWMKVRTPDPH